MRRLSLTGIAIVGLLLVLGGTALASKEYVLNHPGRKKCKASYVTKTKTVTEHGQKTKQVVCQFKAPKPISTTTTLTATLKPGESCAPVAPKNVGNASEGACAYNVSYKTVSGEGQKVPPGKIVIKEHVLPSQDERTIVVTSGASIYTHFYTVSASGECKFNITVGPAFAEYPPQTCEAQSPRMILVAEYVPEPGSEYLASKSPPVTLE